MERDEFEGIFAWLSRRFIYKWYHMIRWRLRFTEHKIGILYPLRIEFSAIARKTVRRLISTVLLCVDSFHFSSLHSFFFLVVSTHKINKSNLSLTGRESALHIFRLHGNSLSLAPSCDTWQKLKMHINLSIRELWDERDNVEWKSKKNCTNKNIYRQLHAIACERDEERDLGKNVRIWIIFNLSRAQPHWRRMEKHSKTSFTC